MEVRKGYKQTEVGVIPEDWNVQPVGEAYEIHNNLRLPISRKIREQMEGPYPYYGPTSVQGYINEYRVEGEYALIGEDGDHFLKWRNQPMTLLVRGQFNVNNHAHLVKGTKNLTKWFYYYFAHRDITPHLTRQGAGRYKLTKRTLLDIPCALPPTLAEQEAIAEALSDADALIESLETLLAKKRQVKQGAMSELLTGKKRLVKSGEWKEKKLSDICWYQEGPGVRTWQFTKSGIKLLNGTNIFRGEINLDNTDRFISENLAYGQYAHFMADSGDIVIASSGITVEKFEEKVAFVRDEHLPLCMNTSTIRFKANKNVLQSSFLYFLLMSDLFKKQIGHQATGSAQLNFGPAHLNKVLFKLPDLAEQTAIAEILSDMDAEIRAVEEKLSKARAVKAGMMSELLGGRVRLV